MLDDVGADYFQVIGEGAQILKRLSEDSPEFFADLARLREIIAALGEDAGQADTQPAGLVFSVDNKEASSAALVEYANGAMLALPDYMIPFENMNVMELAREIQLSGAVTSDPVVENPDAKLKLLEAFVAKGVKHDADFDAASSAATLLEAIRSENPNERQAVIESKAQYDALHDKFQEVYRAALDPVADGMSWGAKDELRRSMYTEWLKIHGEERDRLDKLQSDAWDKANDDRNARYAAARESMAKEGQKVIDAVIAASPVSREQADAWASKQIIDDNAKARLKKNGYLPEKVIKDMADFYLLTGGKASMIRLATDGGRRANAVGIGTRTGEKIIKIDTDFDRTVLWHEMAHHLENDAIAKAVSNGYLEKRRESAKPVKLSKLTGNKGYRSHEVAYKDSFIMPYIGKYYEGGQTEVFAMAVQYLSNPHDALNFAAKDPELFKMATGYLTSPLTPAMKAKLDMHGGAISGKIEKRKSEEEKYAGSIARLSAAVTFTNDDWYANLTESQKRPVSMNLGWREADNAVYVGAWGEYRVFSGKFCNARTGRQGKGYKVFHTVDGGQFWSNNVQAFHGSLEELKAFLSLSEINHRENGLSIGTSWHAYFGASGWDDDRVARINRVAGSLK